MVDGYYGEYEDGDEYMHPHTQLKRSKILHIHYHIQLM